MKRILYKFSKMTLHVVNISGTFLTLAWEVTSPSTGYGEVTSHYDVSCIFFPVLLNFQIWSFPEYKKKCESFFR